MSGEEEIEKLFLSLEIEEPQKNITYSKKDNKYDKFFEMTEKISLNSKYIKDFLFEKKIIGRKFLNNNNEVKYVEIFKNNKFNLLGISPNITFLHLYEPDKENDYNENKFIGFRFYEKGSEQLDSKYFTLINRYDSKYFILEKNKFIRDINNEYFFDKELDCFLIIHDIIIQKYKDNNNTIYGETFPEIIGYCYALKVLNKFNNFIFIEPLIPEPFKPETLIEEIPSKLVDNITYIEPLIYNDHISLIIFTEIKNIRYNIILDMSRYHTNTSQLNKLIFPKSIIDKNFIYPKNRIQNYSSCCLWFFGEIECILKNDKYNSFKSIFDNIKGDNVQFYIDIINIIGKNYYTINNLFLEEKERSRDTNIINLNRLFINGKKKYSIDKNIISSQFLDLNSFLFGSKFFYFTRDTDVIINTQKKLEKFINQKNLLEINYKFYELLKPKKDVKDILETILDELNFINNVVVDIENNYNIEFIKKNIFSYEIYLFNDILKGKPVTFPLPEEVQKKIQEINFDLILNDKDSEFEKRKKDLEENFNIYSIDEIIKHLNPTNNFCYKIMNK